MSGTKGRICLVMNTYEYITWHMNPAYAFQNPYQSLFPTVAIGGSDAFCVCNCHVLEISAMKLGMIVWVFWLGGFRKKLGQTTAGWCLMHPDATCRFTENCIKLSKGKRTHQAARRGTTVTEPLQSRDLSWFLWAPSCQLSGTIGSRTYQNYHKPQPTATSETRNGSCW